MTKFDGNWSYKFQNGGNYKLFLDGNFASTVAYCVIKAALKSASIQCSYDLQNEFVVTKYILYDILYISRKNVALLLNIYTTTYIWGNNFWTRK